MKKKPDSSRSSAELYIGKPHSCGCVWKYKSFGGCHYCTRFGKYRKNKRKHEQKAETKRLARDNRFKRLFGITVDDYQSLLKEQNGVCDICGNTCSTGRELAVDHNHDTGAVRGLLCNHCNTGLGKFGDNIELLSAAVLYLQKHNKADG